MYADRSDRGRHDNGPDRQEKGGPTYVRAASDILAHRLGGPTRKHEFDLYEQGFRWYWRRYDIYGGGLRLGNNPFFVQTSVVVVEQRVLFRGHTVRYDHKFVVPVADRQRDIFRFHRRHVDPLGRLSTRKPCVADQIPNRPRP